MESIEAYQALISLGHSILRDDLDSMNPEYIRTVGYDHEVHITLNAFYESIGYWV